MIVRYLGNLENKNTWDISRVRFRLIGLLDIKEFKAAAKESVESNYEFLGYGKIFQVITPFEYLEFFLSLMNDKNVDHYGLFEGEKLLGHVSHSLGFGPFGTEIIGWVRNGYHSLGIGELGLQVASKRAFETKDFNYTELHINENNKASRTVAEKAGYFPAIKLASFGETNSTVVYMKINPRILRLARQYGRRPLDIINCPATLPGLTSYLSSDRVVEFYEWPFPDFAEGLRPLSYMALDDYSARVHFSPTNLYGLGSQEGA